MRATCGVVVEESAMQLTMCSRAIVLRMNEASRADQIERSKKSRRAGFARLAREGGVNTRRRRTNVGGVNTRRRWRRRRRDLVRVSSVLALHRGLARQGFLRDLRGAAAGGGARLPRRPRLVKNDRLARVCGELSVAQGLAAVERHVVGADLNSPWRRGRVFDLALGGVREHHEPQVLLEPVGCAAAGGCAHA